MLVEHARNHFGINDAVHAEYGEPGTPIITLLACSLNGRTIEVDLTPGTRLARLHDAVTSVEQATCNYGLEPALRHIADGHGMRTAAVDDTGEVRAIELVDHPFFLGTLYMPQLTTSPDAPHPVWQGFIAAL